MEQTTASQNLRPVMSPRALTIELAPSVHACSAIEQARLGVKRIIDRRDNRMIVISGPCSIHDPEAALEYACRLNELRKQYIDKLHIIMRVYFEKPRTSIGWKGLIYDPHMDGSCDMAAGLRTARSLLLSITHMGLGAGMELLDPMISHYIGDLVSWAAIGARTTESQIHRQMASGLAMAVGFKNTTEGLLDSAIS